MQDPVQVAMQKEIDRLRQRVKELESDIEEMAEENKDFLLLKEAYKERGEQIKDLYAVLKERTVLYSAYEEWFDETGEPL